MQPSELTDGGDLADACWAGEIILAVDPAFVGEVNSDPTVEEWAADEEITEFHMARVRCRLCGGEHMSFYPADMIDHTCMECEECHNMTCEPIPELE